MEVYNFGQGQTVTKTVTIARIVTRAATAVAGVGLHVDTTAYVLYYNYLFP